MFELMSRRVDVLYSQNFHEVWSKVTKVFEQGRQSDGENFGSSFERKKVSLNVCSGDCWKE